MLTNLLNTFLVDTTANLNSQLSELKELRRQVQNTCLAESGCTAGPDSHFSAPDLVSRDAAHPS